MQMGQQIKGRCIWLHFDKFYAQWVWREWFSGEKYWLLLWVEKGKVEAKKVDVSGEETCERAEIEIKVVVDVGGEKTSVVAAVRGKKSVETLENMRSPINWCIFNTAPFYICHFTLCSVIIFDIY